MANQANIVVFDGAATPVSHTMEPVSCQKDPRTGAVVSIWREQLVGLPREAQVTVVMTQKEHPSKVVETRTRVNVPVLEAVAGQNAQGYTAAPKVAFIDSVELVQYAHPRSTITSRQIAAQLLRNLTNNVAVTTPALSAGIVYEANVKQILPN